MSTSCVVMVGTGPLPELLMRQVCTGLAEESGIPLSSHAVGESPSAVLEGCSSARLLLRLSGDAAQLVREGGSWLEALADWRTPVLLFTMAEPDGSISGSAAAWSALCRQLKVPLIGLVQLQGRLDAAARRRDGLPWCGWIPTTDHPQRNEAVASLAEVLRRGRLTASSARAAV